MISVNEFALVSYSQHYFQSLLKECVTISVVLCRIDGLPSVSALKFDGALNMAVGTSTGQVDLISSTAVLRRCYSCSCQSNISSAFIVNVY